MKPKINMIVCVAKNNLIGDKNPDGNGLLWHSKEELLYFKEKTLGNVLLFGKNTAKVVPIELMKKTRDVIIISSKDRIEDIIEKYNGSDKEIFICGGATVYEYYIKNFPLDKIYVSKLKDYIEIKTPSSPLYFPNIEKYGYIVSEKKEFNDFIAYTYIKK